jgi:putative membrane protein
LNDNAIREIQPAPGQADSRLAASRPTEPQPDLSAERTYLAHERTLMAWTRTAASLITFGFTIYKFFQGLGLGGQRHPLGYVTFSAVMISIGLVALLLATVQHRHDTHRLELEYHLKPRFITPLMSSLIAALGILGLLAVALRQ